MRWTRIFPALLGVALLVGCGGSESSSGEVQKTAAQGSPPSAAATKTILFFGNSLTAGLGLDNPEEAYPGVIQHWVDSLGLSYRVINAGLSGETSAGGNERIGWLLNERIDVFVLELGANDGLRGLPTEETRKNLQQIIDQVRASYPDCKMVLAGMMIPPSMGGEYGQAFQELFPELARENGMALVPFLLEGVAGETGLNQPDGIHPTAEGHRILAKNVWEVLEPLL